MTASATSPTGLDRIAAAFAHHGRRAALMPYLMGGFPDAAASRAVGAACADGGADLVELGVPYSDPLADGPVIHAAGTAALAAGATLAGVLEQGRELAERLPVVLMCYANLVLARGPEAFARRLADHAISGLIVPDLPAARAGDGPGAPARALREACDAVGVALVPLVAPTTPPARMAEIGAGARGFLYAVGVTGTTGERAGAAAGLGEMLARARAATAVPVALGFGIGTPERAAEAVEAGAQGVIVGSRLVRAAAESPAPAAEVERLVAAFAEALR